MMIGSIRGQILYSRGCNTRMPSQGNHDFGDESVYTACSNNLHYISMSLCQKNLWFNIDKALFQFWTASYWEETLLPLIPNFTSY